ncbi:11394_t:CDS:2, partial [Ambispora leptoticha]
SYKQDLRHVSLNGIHATGGPTKGRHVAGYVPLEEILGKFELKLISSGSSNKILKTLLHQPHKAKTQTSYTGNGFTEVKIA